MENKDTFKMTYSADEQDEIKNIREKYLPKEENKMERLRALDNSAGKKATMVSIIIGVLGTLIMGLGMSLLMSDFGDLLGDAALPVGVALGAVGIAVLAVAYPLYNRILRKEREKIAPEIIRLSDELMK